MELFAKVFIERCFLHSNLTLEKIRYEGLGSSVKILKKHLANISEVNCVASLKNTWMILRNARRNKFLKATYNA